MRPRGAPVPRTRTEVHSGRLLPWRYHPAHPPAQAHDRFRTWLREHSAPAGLLRDCRSALRCCRSTPRLPVSSRLRSCRSTPRLQVGTPRLQVDTETAGQFKTPLLQIDTEAAVHTVPPLLQIDTEAADQHSAPANRHQGCRSGRHSAEERAARVERRFSRGRPLGEPAVTSPARHRRAGSLQGRPVLHLRRFAGRRHSWHAAPRGRGHGVHRRAGRASAAHGECLQALGAHSGSTAAGEGAAGAERSF